MDSVTIKGKPFEFKGEVIEKGAKVNFKAVKLDGSDFLISDVPGIKVISFFPDINTKVCSAQTSWMIKNQKKAEKVTFISISSDTVETQLAWCKEKGCEDALILSDAKYNDFGNNTNLLISSIRKLGRGFMILGGSNHIIAISVNEELSEKANFTVPEQFI